KLETGNIFYGNTKVLGVCDNDEKFLNELGKYEPWELSYLNLNNVIVYNIDNKDFMNFVEYNGGGYGVLIEFKDNLKHPQFDELISKSNYSFDDYYYEYNVLTDGLTVVKTGIIGFLILVFILYMINTINTNSSEMMLRKKEFNILRTIGMSKKQVDKMLYLEGLLVSVIAAFIGNLLGSFLGNAVFNLFMLAGKEPEERGNPVIYIDFPAIILITLLLIIINVFAIWVTKPEDENIILD
ncbi:MAG: ABC transporter permease, partial [Lachnospiraceae bacterium]|nr:ABC transporter permease [Lachnospiraceae bacterium]